MSYQPVYRDGLVHVHRRMCSTCIFRPGNLMRLDEGRVEGMVADSGDDGCIPCHQVLGEEPSVCRGFFDLHKNAILQVAERLDVITFTDPPEKG